MKFAIKLKFFKIKKWWDCDFIFKCFIIAQRIYIIIYKCNNKIYNTYVHIHTHKINVV